jgi:hypothetical protein
VTTAITSLKTPSDIVPSQLYISARVMARQLKGVMKLIYEELLEEVLEGLELEYNQKTRTSWVRSFCLNLILCIIVEELQIICEGMVINNISREGEDPGHAANSAITCCQELEGVLINHSWAIFFARGREYNPINGCPEDDGSGQNQEVTELFDSIRHIMRDYGN